MKRHVIEHKYKELKALYEGGHNVTPEEVIEAQENYIQLLLNDIEFDKRLIEEYRYEGKN